MKLNYFRNNRPLSEKLSHFCLFLYWNVIWMSHLFNALWLHKRWKQLKNKINIGECVFQANEVRYWNSKLLISYKSDKKDISIFKEFRKKKILNLNKWRNWKKWLWKTDGELKKENKLVFKTNGKPKKEKVWFWKNKETKKGRELI